MPINTGESSLSDLPIELMIEQYGGGVEAQFAKSSVMRQYVKIRNIRGTNTLVDNRVGRTTLQKLVAGQPPEAVKTNFGSVSVTVDTVVIARDEQSLLNEFQTHFDVRMQLAEEHGKEIGKLFDQSFLIIANKGAGMAAPANLNGAFGAGKSVTLSSAGDETDPDKLHDAIKSIIVQMEEEEIPLEELIIFVRPAEYAVLHKHNKLLSRDYAAGNGDYARGIITELYGVRLEKTTRIPTSAITGHLLSNAGNNYAYDVSATEAKAVAIIMHPKGLLAGETIPLTSTVWWNEDKKVHCIDSWLAYGVSVNRPDCCGRVLKA